MTSMLVIEIPFKVTCPIEDVGLYCPYCGTISLSSTGIVQGGIELYICSSCESTYYISGRFDDQAGAARKAFRDKKAAGSNP